MKPLDPSLVDASEPSRWERRLQSIPILGWVFAHAMFEDRIRPLVKDIKKQLKEREGFDVRPFWAEDDWPIASKLFDIIRDNMAWKPSVFIPGDPCRIVFWAYTDCLDAVEAQQQIEDEFHMQFTQDDLEHTKCFTLQELVDMIRRKSNQAVEASPLRRPPHR